MTMQQLIGCAAEPTSQMQSSMQVPICTPEGCAFHPCLLIRWMRSPIPASKLAAALNCPDNSMQTFGMPPPPPPPPPPAPALGKPGGPTGLHLALRLSGSSAADFQSQLASSFSAAVAGVLNVPFNTVSVLSVGAAAPQRRGLKQQLHERQGGRGGGGPPGAQTQVAVGGAALQVEVLVTGSSPQALLSKVSRAYW